MGEIVVCPFSENESSKKLEQTITVRTGKVKAGYEKTPEYCVYTQKKCLIV